MHYLGVVAEQITHEDPEIALARRRARLRREARRDRGYEDIGRKHVRFFGGHGSLAPR